MEVSSQLYASATLPHGEGFPSIHCIQGCVGPRDGLDSDEKNLSLPLLGIEPHSSSMWLSQTVTELLTVRSHFSFIACFEY